MDFADSQGEKKEYFAGVITPMVDFSAFLQKSLYQQNFYTRKEGRKEAYRTLNVLIVLT